MKKTIGYNIDVVPEKTEVVDKKSPFSGNVSVRGKLFEGTVVSDAMTRTVKVEWEGLVKDKKYNRYYKTKSSVLAHNAPEVNAKVGDKVLIGETRPLSKRKHFAVLKVLSQTQGGDEQ
jgi:small subunit ribosomal protein S17